MCFEVAKILQEVQAMTPKGEYKFKHSKWTSSENFS